VVARRRRKTIKELSMKQKLILLFLLMTAFSASQSFAQPLNIEPGLWQHSMQMTSQSGQMEEAMRQARQQLEALPPAQRQMMEQMMAAQGMAFGKDETSFRLCITAEDIARNELHLADENCTQQIVERTGNRIHVRFACAGDPPSRGEGNITIVNPREYTGTAVIHTEMDGKPEQFNINQKARWISADCSNLSR
jgi:hypothetical protein